MSAPAKQWHSWSQRDEPDRIRGRRLQAIRAAHFAKHPFCVECLAEKPPRYTVAIELDHIVALVNGGEDVESNRQGLCKRHHVAKTRRDMGWGDAPSTIGVDGWPVDGT